jgi:ferritin-like metal-binding protein YciE
VNGCRHLDGFEANPVGHANQSGGTMPKVITLHELFVEQLKDIYYAEKKILRSLPKMGKAVGKESELAAAFEKHREETVGQVERLEQVFKSIGEKPKGKKCAAIEGLAEEADELMDEVENTATLEAGLLAGAQAVEHYEIARYGTLIEWAKVMGHDEAAGLLQETLEEEKKTDQALGKMATSRINRNAFDAASENDGETPEASADHKRARKSRAA